MNRLAAIGLATSLAMLSTVAAGGCGFGPGKSSPGEADLTVTREFGTIPLVDATLEDPTPSDTVVRFLDANAEVETSYGGNFVDSIDGYEGSVSGGGDEDWFFFVNGYYSDIGAGETEVQPGDRIWWDYRYWSAAYRVPAVVGSWPEPFLHGYDGKRYSTVVECLGASDDCGRVIAALRGAGIEPEVEAPPRPVAHPDQLRVLVGPWDALRSDPAARQLESGPDRSGVYGRVVRCGAGWALETEDSHGRPVETLSAAGLVAAVRENRDQPTWIVAGTDESSVSAAGELVDADSLGDRYAVATSGDAEVPLPATAESAGGAQSATCGGE